MLKLIYQIHRWGGLALALFMVLWLASGLVIAYSGNLLQTRDQQLSHQQALEPQGGWLSLGEVWKRSADFRHRDNGGEASAADEQISSARLLRVAGEPTWVVQDGKARSFALSAIDGSLLNYTPEQSVSIARQWLGSSEKTATLRVSYAETLGYVSSLRNYLPLKPFHRITLNDASGTELLISARTGEVLQAAGRFDHGLYYAGNWVHTFRPLDAIGLADSRRDVLIWAGFTAAAAGLTGMIIGWLRWRPRWGKKPQYPQGRTQPYREVWLRWHFWSGLIGGTFALLWAVSGYLVNNPWQIFSNATATNQELARYQGKELPSVIRDWAPASLDASAAVVEVSWHRLGNQAVLLAYDRDGHRTPQQVAGAVGHFDDQALIAASQRLAGADLETSQLLTSYDNYYYPNHRQGLTEKPLPVLRIDLADAGHTHLYVDPQDGRLLLKQDSSRRAYRWLFSALHHWDIGWLYVRPLWDGWMISWISFGLVLSVSSVILGWRRLRRTFRRPEPEAVPQPAAAE